MSEKATDILEQSAEIFLRYGVKSITMDELSRQLAISKKTLYQFFTDKTDLIEKTLHYISDNKGCQFAKIHDMGLNAIEELFKVYQLAYEMIRKHNPALEFDLQRFYPSVYRKVKEAHRKNIYNATIENLVKGKTEGYYRQDLNEEVITKLHIIRVENFIHNDLISVEEIHSKAFFEEVFKYHLYGIISPKGLQFIQTHYPEFIHH
ncbi:MAG: TetR/AcrR family transcriptional regulator [Bacteroidales bacterium]|nr:TetR/AcrR family transcriptional regulator [Bacteroidales bacterium]